MVIPSDIEPRLRELLSTFLYENSQINLSALRTDEACWIGNICDSLSFLELISQNILPTPSSILDLGAGGGFPLLPLAIALPKVKCTGLDSIAKKMDAVRRITESLGLKNVQVIADRAEVIAHKRDYRESFDVVTSRAVAPLATLLEYTVPFASPKGHVVLWKSMHIDEELQQSENAQKKLSCSLAHSHVYDLGGDWGKRQLLVFKKHGATSKLYPREVGMPKKTPLE